jgi:hypothetical protein
LLQTQERADSPVAFITVAQELFFHALSAQLTVFKPPHLEGLVEDGTMSLEEDFQVFFYQMLEGYLSQPHLLSREVVRVQVDLEAAELEVLERIPQMQPV